MMNTVEYHRGINLLRIILALLAFITVASPPVQAAIVQYEIDADQTMDRLDASLDDYGAYLGTVSVSGTFTIDTTSELIVDWNITTGGQGWELYTYTSVNSYLANSTGDIGVGNIFKSIAPDGLIKFLGLFLGASFVSAPLTDQINVSESSYIPGFGQPMFVSDADITVTQVPVPAAIWLFSSGLIGLIGLARSKANA